MRFKIVESVAYKDIGTFLTMNMDDTKIGAKINLKDGRRFTVVDAQVEELIEHGGDRRWRTVWLVKRTA